MRLFLIQHGLAKSKDEDPERPLTDQGRDDSDAMAKIIASGLQKAPKHIYHSGKTRAQQTAEIFAAQMGASADLQFAEGLSPMDNPREWFDRLKEMHEDTMLVGHLPHLSRLASLILVGNPEKSVIRFANSGVVCLQRDNSGEWSVAWMIVPRLVD